MKRPLLFLDVDGALIPFGAKEYPSYGSPGSFENPLLSRLNPEHGRRLLALGCDLMWATTWMDDANESIAPRLELPRLPVVTWPDDPETEDQDARNGLHWKTRTLVVAAAGRPFVWLDDEITPRDRSWVSMHHPGPALPHRVDPRTGLTPSDFQAIEEWLRSLNTST